MASAFSAVVMLLAWHHAEGQCAPLLERDLGTANDCAYGGCCNAVTGWHKTWIDPAINRTGAPSAVLNMVATAVPFDSVFGIANVADRPRSADSLLGLRQYIGMSLHIYRLPAINQKSQKITVHYKITWFWRDCREVFSCGDELRVSQSHPLYENFWTPPLFIAEKEFEEMTVLQKTHVLLGEGIHNFVEEHVSTIRCSFDFKDMPLDQQTCKMTFSLPGYAAALFDLQWVEITSEKLTSSEWEIQQGSEWTMKAQNGTSRFSPHLLPTDALELTAEFALTRYPAYLLQEYVTTAILFYVLSYMGLWLDPGAVPARVAAGVIPALTTSNKMSSLSAFLPPIAYATRLSKFMLLTLMMIVLHFVEYGFVHGAGKRAKFFTEQDKRASDASTEEGVVPVKPAVRAQLERRIVGFIHAYGEIAARILSPIIYLVAAAVILFA